MTYGAYDTCKNTGYIGNTITVFYDVCTEEPIVLYVPRKPCPHCCVYGAENPNGLEPEDVVLK